MLYYMKPQKEMVFMIIEKKFVVFGTTYAYSELSIVYIWLDWFAYGCIFFCSTIFLWN